MASLREIKGKEELVLLTRPFVFQLWDKGNNESDARRNVCENGIHEFIIKKIWQ
jgi:hypothetical protein